MLMRDGGIVAAGALEDVLTEEHLSEAFGLPLKVSRADGRYSAVARTA
jgi:iron complex transport system ATP-binding protein